MSHKQPANVRYALVGAAGDYGRTVLAQTLGHPHVHPSVLCDLDSEAVGALLETLGRDVPVSRDLSEIHVVGTLEGMDDHYDVLVEATGNVRVGIDTARAAIQAGKHVVMASKETDSVAGPYLAHLAAQHGVTYALAAGDQPANLVSLLDYANVLGLDVIAAGKSSEYDLVVDPDGQGLTHVGERVATPSLPMTLPAGEDMHGVLASRAQAVSGLKLRAAADACEIAAVANATGIAPDHPSLHYPVARTTELADIYAESGGILRRRRTLDVFAMLRRHDEASFGGGVFVVARVHDPVTAKILASKGHVISADHTRVCLFHPYHLMGLETVATIANAGRTQQVQPQAHVSLIARARVAVARGARLSVAGHHHELQVETDVGAVDVNPFGIEIHPTGGEMATWVPYYLLHGAVARRDIGAGQPVTYADVDGIDTVALDAWRQSLNLRESLNQATVSPF